MHFSLKFKRFHQLYKTFGDKMLPVQISSEAFEPLPHHLARLLHMVQRACVRRAVTVLLVASKGPGGRS
jgi:hypothetical protein